MFEFFQNFADFIGAMFEGIFNGFESLISVVKNIFSGTSTFLEIASDIVPFSNQVLYRIPSLLFPAVVVCLGLSIYKGVAHGN